MWLLENLLAPIVVGIVVWVLTEKKLNRPWQGELARKDAMTPAEAELPLTVQLEGDLPIGYYKLDENTAKRMEPRFYAQLKDYIAQVFAVAFFGIALAISGFIAAFNGEIDDLQFAFIGLIVFVALIPWKMFFKRYR